MLAKESQEKWRKEGVCKQNHVFEMLLHFPCANPLCFFIGPHGFVSDAALGIGCGIAALHYLAPDVLTVWDQLCGGMIRIVCSPMFLDNRCGLCHERLRILLPLLKKHITCSHTTLAVMYVYNQAMTDLRAGDVTIRAALGLDEVCVCFV